MSEAEVNRMPVANSSDQYVEDGKNKLAIKCKYCTSKILDKKMGNYVIIEKDLPLMAQDNRKEDVQSESVTEYYEVDNMYTFENIGFTHTIANTKYLSCADCDAGPIGYHDLITKHSFVALSRVEHV